MTRLRFVVLAVLMTAIGLTFLSKLNAQGKSITASLSGTVSDPSGARIPKAALKLTDPQTWNHPTRTVPARPGTLPSPFCRPAPTSLRSSAPGFKTTRQNGIVLTPGDSVSIAMTLTVGATEQVTVNTTGPLLQTEDSNISTELTTSNLRSFRSTSEMTLPLRR